MGPCHPSLPFLCPVCLLFLPLFAANSANPYGNYSSQIHDDVYMPAKSLAPAHCVSTDTLVPKSIQIPFVIMHSQELDPGGGEQGKTPMFGIFQNGDPRLKEVLGDNNNNNNNGAVVCRMQHRVFRRNYAPCWTEFPKWGPVQFSYFLL